MIPSHVLGKEKREYILYSDDKEDGKVMFNFHSRCNLGLQK
jgi:hypothetical protein